MGSTGYFGLVLRSDTPYPLPLAPCMHPQQLPLTDRSTVNPLQFANHPRRLLADSFPSRPPLLALTRFAHTSPPTARPPRSRSESLVSQPPIRRLLLVLHVPLHSVVQLLHPGEACCQCRLGRRWSKKYVRFLLSSLSRFLSLSTLRSFELRGKAFG